MSLDDLNVQRLKRLIRKLEETHPLSDYQVEMRKDLSHLDMMRRYSPEELEAYREKFKPTTVDRSPPADAKDNLGWQVAVFEAYWTDYMRFAWPLPPNVPWRITVILRRGKLFEIEREFLDAYFGHFWSVRGSSTDTKLGQRAVKVGLAIPSIPDSTPLPLPDFDELPLFVDGVATLFFSPEDLE